MRTRSDGKAWRVVGASVPGESHRKNGQPCQDSHRWQEVKDGILIAAAADGAGSAASSRIGATVATQAAVDATASNLRLSVPAADPDWKNLLRSVFHGVRHELLKHAAKLDTDAVQLATTLLVTIATPNKLIVGQVGDGAVVARTGEDDFFTVTKPAGQEYVNETTFLTSPGFIDRAQFVVHHGSISGLALLTDGLQMLALRMPDCAPHAAFFGPLLKILAEDGGPAVTKLRHFLQSPRIAERADDDLTLVLAVRTE